MYSPTGQLAGHACKHILRTGHYYRAQCAPYSVQRTAYSVLFLGRYPVAKGERRRSAPATKPFTEAPLRTPWLKLDPRRCWRRAARQGLKLHLRPGGAHNGPTARMLPGFQPAAAAAGASSAKTPRLSVLRAGRMTWKNSAPRGCVACCSGCQAVSCSAHTEYGVRSTWLCTLCSAQAERLESASSLSTLQVRSVCMAAWLPDSHGSAGPLSTLHVGSVEIAPCCRRFIWQR